MKILGIDTSTNFLCIGFYNKGKIYTYRLKADRKHSVLLVPTIKRIIDSLKIKCTSIDYFAVGLGPGSFTGIRIGLSVIKGLALATNKSVVGISSLDIIAANALRANYSGFKRPLFWDKICPIIDAKRNLVYSAFYRIEGDALQRVTAYKLISIQELVKNLPAKVVCLGDGLGVCEKELRRVSKKAILLEKDFWYPQPISIIELAQERIKEGKISNAFKLKPIYLYPKECQVRPK
jgi:tRNA threonylcarbamoyladenosine biosynthesis protein TsaB